MREVISGIQYNFAFVSWYVERILLNLWECEMPSKALAAIWDDTGCFARRIMASKIKSCDKYKVKRKI
jgi:hypothetical protein